MSKEWTPKESQKESSESRKETHESRRMGNFSKEWGSYENQSCPKCGDQGEGFNSFENYCYKCSWDGEHPGDREEVKLPPLQEKSGISLSTAIRLMREAADTDEKKKLVENYVQNLTKNHEK